MAEDFYTQGQYLQKNPEWHVQDSPWKAQQILKMIERNSLRPRTVGEIGCGAGEILKQLQDHLPADVLFSGYEVSPQAYEFCKQRQGTRLRFYLKDLLRDRQALFDLLLIVDVVEHVEDYLGFLKKLRDKSRDKIFHIPLDISVQRVLLGSPILRRRKEVGHLHYFTKETALATLEDTGYEIVDYFYRAGSLDLPAKSIIYFMGKLPLRFMSMFNKDLAVRILGGHSLMILAR